ncbi:hypothetical protein INT45_013602 [Circinella minor]|uniref:Uncharacterized protein n=1 Tax=Circinella minor TaxID=1195481 RepID=A0A8H7RPD8_9FUNG|nr:hypothetical protein INT45_013602 [Circinella minor]
MDHIVTNELSKLNQNYWQFLDTDYPIKISKYKHRTEIKNVNNIDKVKEILINKLGYIPVFFFLVMIFNNGNSYSDMNDYLPSSLFSDIYNQFWNENKNDLNNYITELLENMFSNTILRILKAKDINPVGFKNLTLFLDGYDSRIDYLKNNMKSRNLYSYNFKKSGIRTQVIYDINEFAIFVSESKSCKNYNNGKMFLDMKLENKLSDYECIAFDGGYYYYTEKFIENCERKEVKLNHVLDNGNQSITKKYGGFSGF